MKPNLISEISSWELINVSDFLINVSELINVGPL